MRTVPTTKKPRAPRGLKVLFIGNSFTARNNLPGLVASLAEAGGRHLDHRLISRGGASLRMHWNKGEAQAVIADSGVDFVVLQEQSTLPIKNAARFHESVRLFDTAIRSAGAKTALYMTWARRHAPESQAPLSDAYTSIGRELGATVAGVGVAWERFRREHKTPELFDKDGSHPTIAGSFLAACVIYQAVFDDRPAAADATIPGLSASDVRLLAKGALAGATRQPPKSTRT